MNQVSVGEGVRVASQRRSALKDAASSSESVSIGLYARAGPRSLNISEIFGKGRPGHILELAIPAHIMLQPAKPADDLLALFQIVRKTCSLLVADAGIRR